MASDRLIRFLSLLQDVKQVSDTRWTFKCPCHTEKTGSGSVTETASSNIVTQCFGCGANGKTICEAIGFPVKDLFPPGHQHGKTNGKTNGKLDNEWSTIDIRNWDKLVGHYVYENPDGTPRFCVIKYRYNDAEPKKFVQYRAAGPGNWHKGLEDNTNGVKSKTELTIYHLPEVIEAVKTSRVIYIVEGEGDVETLREREQVATCNPQGAGKWQRGFAKHFIGANVVIFPDNDDVGRKHAQAVADSLHGKAKEVRVVELPDLPEKGDVTDWFATGGTLEEMWALVAAVAPWKPSKEEAIAQVAERVNMTDMGNATRFATMHGEEIRYCGPWKRWLIWDGRRWLRDDRSIIVTRAEKTVKAIAREAEGVDGDFRATLKWAIESESAARIFSMIKLAYGKVPATPDEFDRDPWALNVLNGTLDLRTGRLRPHVKTDMATKLVPIKYDPDAKCPTWDAFLQKIMESNDHIVNFLRRAVGYTLTGDTSEHVMFVLHGTGRNGKSTFIEAVRTILADYAQTAEFTTWSEKKTDTVRNDIADLRGARFVSTIEASSGKKLDEQMIKSVTGGDEMKARFLYEEYFTFTPQLKLWLAANHKPGIRGADAGIWSRILLIPFNIFLSPDQRDKRLKEKLYTEAPGILAWAVRGCLEWQERGLDAPLEVLKATEVYRTEMDSLGAFFEDRCALHPPFKAMATDLFTHYIEWCEENGETPTSQRFFGLRLAERGLKKDRDTSKDGGSRVRWNGIGLLEYLSPIEKDLWKLEQDKRARQAAAEAEAAAEKDAHTSENVDVAPSEGLLKVESWVP